MLAHLRSCERAAYPELYRQLQDVYTMAELRTYCEGEPKVWTWHGGYCIATADELVDLVSTVVLSLATMRWLLSNLTSHFAGAEVTMDARATTSWPLLKIAARRGYVDIISSQPWHWGGEVFHESVVRFLVHQ